MVQWFLHQPYDHETIEIRTYSFLSVTHIYFTNRAALIPPLNLAALFFLFPQKKATKIFMRL